MSGEGLSVSFRRTKQTTKSNQQLLEEFQDLVYSNKKIMSHMKWYGKAHTLDILEHGDDNRQKFEQEYVAIKDTFQFEISVYESWYEDADVYESHERKDSFVSLAKEFAQNNNLMYFPQGFPAEWIEGEIIDGKKNWNHYVVKPDDKNIDRICEVWYDYGMQKLKNDSKELWYQARDKIKQLMENRHECEYAK
tara:strand:+ start:1777 stop:2355 length:579 start_codon:yes stop_codon:yes gene_type:complete